MLSIDNLHVSVEGRPILKGLSLAVKPGEVHAIMGPNGAGKSTLASVLAGREGYEVIEGEVVFEGQNLLEMAPEERSHAGVFLAFQYPVEIPGVSMIQFLRAALNAHRAAKGLEPLDTSDLMALLREKAALLKLDPSFLSRSVNEGFSGGERKRAEIFQMAVLDPKLVIMDETDSGLDIDALRVVSEAVNALRSPGRAFVIITHYYRILQYIRPDFVHILADGRIVRSGGAELALELEEKGYEPLLNPA
ncbi:MAG: Fe-S cluster assembly ATPase SufC [Bacteroidia bacterium]|nr:Fe-S cluster assembly ATPase SufC [Bacteroidia bacterium]MCX7652110.1 Fe-S cluster assembly ATPase SufC [Bacteroidia bacterium]MDW8417500.1 Fe-S cluster assembly ATPase SufC [Bacteroidia bacterium]